MGAMKQAIPIDTSQQALVRERTRYFITQAEEILNTALPELPVLFDLRGRASGMYRVRGRNNKEIRYNPWIFALHFDDCIATTVPHEVAHYCVDMLYGLRSVRPHGREWKAMMSAFGADASVTASYSLEGVPVRRTRSYAYSCACGEHKLGIRRHNKVIRGEARYSCRRCRSVLELKL